MNKQSLFQPIRISGSLVAHFWRAVLPVCLCVCVWERAHHLSARLAYANIVISLNNEASERVGSPFTLHPLILTWQQVRHPGRRLGVSRARIRGVEASQPAPDRREDEIERELQEQNTNSGLKALSPDAYKCLIYFHAAVPPLGRCRGGLQRRGIAPVCRQSHKLSILCRGGLIICCYPSWWEFLCIREVEKNPTFSHIGFSSLGCRVALSSNMKTDSPKLSFFLWQRKIAKRQVCWASWCLCVFTLHELNPGRLENQCRALEFDTRRRTVRISCWTHLDFFFPLSCHCCSPPCHHASVYSNWRK